LLASTRPRAIESALAVAEGREVARDPIFIEAPLPPPSLPRFIRLSPRTWGVVARLWWWAFNHHEGQETHRQAVIRSHEAADRIEALAAEGQNVVVLAHGFFNYMVGRALVRRGWKLAESQGWKYWSVRRFERK
jgi:broad specificity phosphatase PhoE